MEPLFVLCIPSLSLSLSLSRLCLCLSEKINAWQPSLPSAPRSLAACGLEGRGKKRKKDRYRFLEALPWRCFRRTSIYRCSKRVLEWRPLMAGIDWANRTWQAQKYHYRAVSRWQAALLPLLRHDADREDSDYQALRHGTGFVSLLFSSPAFTLTRRLCSRAVLAVCAGLGASGRSVVARRSVSRHHHHQALQLVALSTLLDIPSSL